MVDNTQLHDGYMKRLQRLAVAKDSLRGPLPTLCFLTPATNARRQCSKLHIKKMTNKHILIKKDDKQINSMKLSQ